MTKEDYNKEPVHYCASCLSLKVKNLDDIKLVICEDCGNTDIKKAGIDSWNMLYVNEYGGLFLPEEAE